MTLAKARYRVRRGWVIFFVIETLAAFHLTNIWMVSVASVCNGWVWGRAWWDYFRTPLERD